MKKRWTRLCAILLICCLLLGGCNAPVEPQKPVEEPPVQTQPVPEPVPEPTPEPVPVLPDPPQPDSITYLSALEPAPAAPEAFEIAAVLDYLCSTAFGGRQTGTDGCLQAGRYVAGLLEGWGYQPLFEDSVIVPYTMVAGDPALAEAEVTLHFTGGDITLTEGVDFTYTFHPEGFNVKLPISGDPKECLTGEAAYLWTSGGREGARIVLRKAGGIISSGSDIWGTENNKLGDLRVTLSDNAFAVAEQATHVTLRMKASAKEMERENICAVLPGADRTQAMVLCGHFDGTGTWGEVLYPSAHDNASGTVTLLECARQLAEESLPFDLVICAFSGEEQSLKGSEALAPVLEQHYDLLNVINLDCLGCGQPDSLALGEVGEALSGALWPYLQQAGYTSFFRSNASSDHDSFTQPAVCVGELYDGGRRFHQPNDTVDAIDPVWLQRIADAVCAYVQQAQIITTVEVDPIAPENTEAVLEQRRKEFAGDLSYDEGIGEVLPFGETALFTGWHMLESIETVQTYYPELQLPETVDGIAFYGAYVIPEEGAVFIGDSGQWETGKIYTVDWNSLPVDSVWAYYMNATDGFFLHVGGNSYDRAHHPADYDNSARAGYAHRGKNGKFAGVWYVASLANSENGNCVDKVPRYAYTDEETVQRIRKEVQDTLEHLTVWYAEHRN